MKRISIFLLLLTGIASCRKDDHACPGPEAPAAGPSTASYTMLQPGNYWIYEQIRIDTNGGETFVNIDSSYVSGTVVFGGNTYAVYHDFLGDHWLRDSSGFLVDSGGTIHLTTAIMGVPVVSGPWQNQGYSSYQTLTTRPTITVPAGTFTNTLDWQGTFYLNNPQWGNPLITHHNYAENVGLVRRIFSFLNQPDTYELRLLRYHVQ
jgi:hypothetical protein